MAEGKRHPDRDAQFRYIAAQAREHLAAGQPVISVDAKKKELAGDYGQAGREWRRRGDPVQVRSHDFPGEQGGHAIPYGICDVGANTGFVNIGTDHSTAAFAVESIRRWRDLMGKDAYPHAARLLICCDAGGSNDWRNRAWKAGIAELAQQAGLQITICHFPPGTSKWNQIEHRLFSQITLAWRGRPLTSHDVIISTIGAVTTRTGLTAAAVLDQNRYPVGTRVSDAQVKDLQDRALTRHAFHGDWNYAFPPVPRPAPPPPPPPAPPGPDLDALAHPALTGMSRAAFDDLAASLELPYAAAREQRLHLDRGRGRRKSSGPPPRSSSACPPTCPPPSAATASACPARPSPPSPASTTAPSAPPPAASRTCSASTAPSSPPAPAASAPWTTCASTPQPPASPSPRRPQPRTPPQLAQ